jgi:hypothetical protein
MINLIVDIFNVLFKRNTRLPKVGIAVDKHGM